MAQPHGSAVSIGATGMLAAATHHLVASHTTTLVVARHATRFCQSLTGSVALDADWNGVGFHRSVADALDRIPSSRTALLWLHRLESDLPALIPRLSGARIVLVLGSMDGAPALPPFSDVVTVRLGSVATASVRRWLTNQEIAAGAIAALDDGVSRIVGDLLPVR